MASLGRCVVNEPTTITTEPTGFALEGHRPCQHCGYDLVGTPIERAKDLDLPVIRCPECGQLNPLIGTPPLGPFAQRAATVGTLIRLLLIGLASIFLWTVAFSSVQAMGESMFHSQANEGLRRFFKSTGDSPEEQRVLEMSRQDDATLADVIAVVRLYQERPNSNYDLDKLLQSQIKDLLAITFILGLICSWLLLPQGWLRAGLATLVIGMLAAGAGVASLYASTPLNLRAQPPGTTADYVAENHEFIVVKRGMERMYAPHGATLFVATLVMSSVVARPLARWAFRFLVPIEHLSGVDLLWNADGLQRASPVPSKDQPTVES